MTDRPAIDLTRNHFMRELGDLVVFGTWVYNDEQEDTEPALVLLPRYRPPSTVTPCVIALSAAYRYNDAKYCVHAAKGIAKALGFEDSMTRTHSPKVRAATLLCHLVGRRGWFILAKRASRLLHQPRVRQPLLPRLYIL